VFALWPDSGSYTEPIELMIIRSSTSLHKAIIYIEDFGLQFM
jgi:hypothetical protein